MVDYWPVMDTPRIVVDGSNIATEGRSSPSLAQLDDAVRQLQAEMPGHQVIVVVDATFGHRIDPSERPAFDEAEAHGEVVSPPAGTIGRGDAFLLQVADRAGAVVLSNDSFQEFHGEHQWLFDPGRLIGGKPVQGVGWIFTPRTPVRGAKSRVAVAKAKSAAAGAGPTGAKSASRGKAAARLASAGAGTERPQIGDTRPAPVLPTAASTGGRRKRAAASAPVSADAAIAPDLPAPGRANRPRPSVQTPGLDGVELPAAASGGGERRRRARRKSTQAEPVNDPLTFLTFVADHPLGSVVTATVDAYVSHGAMALVGDMRCYLPVRNLGDPPPVKARQVLTKGEQRAFVLVALDPTRRGAELALPEVAPARLAELANERRDGLPTVVEVGTPADRPTDSPGSDGRNGRSRRRRASAPASDSHQLIAPERSPAGTTAATPGTPAATPGSPTESAPATKRATTPKKTAATKTATTAAKKATAATTKTPATTKKTAPTKAAATTAAKKATAATTKTAPIKAAATTSAATTSAATKKTAPTKKGAAAKKATTKAAAVAKASTTAKKAAAAKAAGPATKTATTPAKKATGATTKTAAKAAATKKTAATKTATTAAKKATAATTKTAAKAAATKKTAPTKKVAAAKKAAATKAATTKAVATTSAAAKKAAAGKGTTPQQPVSSQANRKVRRG